MPDRTIDPSTKVMIIDDVSSARKIVRRLLEKIGLSDIVEEPSGLSALERLRKEEFQLVISDWNMPGMGGLELLRAVRLEDRLKTLPFIMITSSTDATHVTEAALSGVTDYIGKPFSQDVLVEKIALVLARGSTEATES